MTVVGSGGVSFSDYQPSRRFSKEFRKLDSRMQAKAEKKLVDLFKNPMPAGLRFEKLSGYKNPDIYTFHVTGNYKISLECIGHATAFLRRVGTHDEIDRAP